MFPDDRRQSWVKAFPAQLYAGPQIPLGCVTQHEPRAFRRQPMPISEALIVGLGIRQAEFGLVEEQKRGLLGLETTGLEGLAAVVQALPATARLGWKNTSLMAAAGQKELPAQRPTLCWQ
jgi:hypothetical protein